MEVDVLICYFSNGVSFIGFKNEIELLRVMREERKLSS